MASVHPFGYSGPAPNAHFGTGQHVTTVTNATHQTNIITIQPTAPIVTNTLLVGTVKGHRDWTTGLFGCCEDCMNACCTLCCLSCMISQIASRLDECFCVPCCVPAAVLTMRTRIRTLGGIRGGMCEDCLTLSFCGMCAVCQMSREMDAMGL